MKFSVSKRYFYCDTSQKAGHCNARCEENSPGNRPYKTTTPKEERSWTRSPSKNNCLLFVTRRFGLHFSVRRNHLFISTLHRDVRATLHQKMPVGLRFYTCSSSPFEDLYTSDDKSRDTSRRRRHDVDTKPTRTVLKASTRTTTSTWSLTSVTNISIPDQSVGISNPATSTGSHLFVGRLSSTSFPCYTLCGETVFDLFDHTIFFTGSPSLSICFFHMSN